MAYPRKQNGRPYKRRRTTKNYASSKPYARISNGGVGGAANQMVPKPMPPPQEVKTYDIDVAGTASGTGFTLMSSAAGIGPCFMAGITPGANSNQRVGRQIRVVGTCLRGVFDSKTLVPEGFASTIDIFWDKQANGVAPTSAALMPVVYDFGAGSSIINLPNSNFVKRFSFVKRLQVSGRAGIPTALQLIDATIKMNKLVIYDSATASATSVEQNSLLLSIASVGAGSTFVGTLRIMFVDA